MNREKQPNIIPIEERIRVTYESVLLKSQSLGKSKIFDAIEGSAMDSFLDSVVKHQTIFFYSGTKLYEEHMQAAEKNAGFTRPFGVEMATLSQDTKLVLYPKTIFKPDAEDRKMAKEEGMEVVTEGPQAMIYFLDGFADREPTISDFIVNNFLFIPAIATALAQGKYPLDKEEKSEEFKQEVKNALYNVRKFVRETDENFRKDLSSSIRNIGDLDDLQLEDFAASFIRYQTEAIKPVGLVEPDQLEKKEKTAQQAVDEKTEYFHISDRNLPKRPAELNDTPSLPWRELGTNKWNKDAELYGRYEIESDGKIFKVDFKLDSKFFPSRYGYTPQIEIIEVSDSKIKQHMILGQEIENPLNPFSVFPIIIAGDFDFNDSQTKSILELLINSQGAKHEIKLFLSDVLKISKKGKLERILFSNTKQD